MNCPRDFAETDLFEFDDRDIQIRAEALFEASWENPADRMVLLHATAMMHAALAHNQPNPVAALEELLRDQAASTRDILRTVLAMTNDTSPPERKS